MFPSIPVADFSLFLTFLLVLVPTTLLEAFSEETVDASLLDLSPRPSRSAVLSAANMLLGADGDSVVEPLNEHLLPAGSVVLLCPGAVKEGE